MKIAVLKEAVGETRCAAIPETVKKFIALGATVAVERGAGETASIPDALYEDAGAELGLAGDVVNGAQIVLAVQAPEPAALARAAPGAAAVSSGNQDDDEHGDQHDHRQRPPEQAEEPAVGLLVCLHVIRGLRHAQTPLFAFDAVLIRPAAAAQALLRPSRAVSGAA